MMNFLVGLVVSALWAVAYVLVVADAAYSCRPILGPGTTITDSAVVGSPSFRQLRSWLAHRLLSPPGSPRLETA
ncbi:MAG: hypothetical protein WBV06_00325 [Acidimicrobiia bacterium]